MATTQQHIPIKDIKDNLIILKDGSFVAILKTSAVNFDLLSENEQLAIISSFAGLLNSLSFAIQIVIRSKRLDISNYVNLLVQAQSQQANPLLKQMMERYRVFIETIIKENEVLDKQFYVVVSISSLELGIGLDEQKKLDKAQTLILPRVDHLIRQLSRAGLSADLLDTDGLIKLFYDIYNEQIPMPWVSFEGVVAEQAQPISSEKPTTPQITPTPIAPPVVQTQTITSQTQPLPIPASQTSQAPQQQPSPRSYQPPSSHAPYIVEELHDDYGTV